MLHFQQNDLDLKHLGTNNDRDHSMCRNEWRQHVIRYNGRHLKLFSTDSSHNRPFPVIRICVYTNADFRYIQRNGWMCLNCVKHVIFEAYPIDYLLRDNSVNVKWSIACNKLTDKDYRNSLNIHSGTDTAYSSV